MGRIRIFFIILFYFLLQISVHANKQTLKVGIQHNFPPYEFSSNEKIIGFNIDILHQLADLFSLDIEFVQSDITNLQTMLDSGKIDFISFCFQSQTNKSTYSLSIPYNMVAYGLFVPYESDIENPQDIMPTRISLQNEQLNQTFINNKNFAGNTILRKTQEECLQDVIDSNAEVAIIATLTGKYLVEKHGFKSIKIPPINFRSLQYSFAFAKNNDSLLVQFNEGLNILRETGTYNRIYQKWFGKVHPNQKEKTKAILIWPYYLLSLLIITLVIMFVVQRKRYLEIKDMKKTEILIRQHAEKSLFEHQKLIDSIIDQLPHVIFVKNSKNQFILANEALAKLLGTAKENILQQNLGVFAETDKTVQQLIDYNKDKDIATADTIQFIDATSQLKTFEVIKKTFITPINIEKSLVVIAIDISKREKYEKMLREEKALLSSLINSLPDLIFYKNKQLEYIGGNEAFCKFNNFASKDEFIGKTDFDIYNESIANQYLESDKYLLSTKQAIQFTRWEGKNAEDKKLYDTMKVPILDENGKLTGIVGISHDITKQARTQQQIENAKNKAEQSDKLKTTFLTNLSHEIRTPLNSIIGFSDLLTDPDLTDDQREEFTELISKSGASLLTLVDDIIDLSKIETNKVILNNSKFNLNRMIIDLHEAINDGRDMIQKKSVALEYFIPGNEELAFTIQNDEFRLRQVLSNLIKNGLKHTSKGEVKFGYRTEKSEIIFFVKDTGLGVPKDQQSSIFERYDKVDSFEQFGGSGLGLSISKKLVDLFGGTINFKTNEMEGSEFFFTIPIDLEMQNLNNDIQTASESYDWKNIEILIAENEQNNYLFLEETLKKTGANIIWVTDGVKAVETVKTNPNIQLVLMDIKMPKMDGYEATRQIKKLRKNLPVIAQTAYAMSDERDLSIQAGCDEYLTKPIRPKNLLKKINQLL